MGDRVLFRAGVLSPGQLELAKFVGFAAMVWDHVSAIFFGVYVTAFGRLALPIFAMALADGVARSARPESTFKRLVVCGLISQPVYMLAFDVPYGNVLLTFACGVGVPLSLRRWDSWGIVPAVLCLYLAFLCEGSVFAAFVVVAAYYACRRDRGIEPFVFLVLAIASLQVVNGSAWALVSLPVVYFISKLPVQLPRVRGLFYWAYPLHLSLLLVGRAVFAQSG